MSDQQPPQQQPGWAGQPQQPYPQNPYGQPQAPKGAGAGKIIGIGCAGLLGLAVVIGVAVAVAGGSSSDSVTSTPVSHAATSSKAASDKKASPAAKKPQEARTGDTITVTGYEDGSKLDVTVVKVADPAKSSDVYLGPDNGKRYVGVQFKLVNTGTAVYSDSPSNGAQVADSKGQQFQTTFADITAGPSMSTAVKLKPGATALGWIVFEVPKASKLATVQFTMDSGFADQTGEWKLG